MRFVLEFIHVFLNKILFLLTMAYERIFTNELIDASLNVHSISDRLMNAKLAFALSNDKVWADGLLAFFEVFKYLECAMSQLSNTLLGELNIAGMGRTQAFETDLDFYTGFAWRVNYAPRESVIKYLDHLQQLEDEDPALLVPYIYHLYMSLLSGVQIINGKRELFKKFVGDFSRGGNALTDFGDLQIHQLKLDLTNATNKIAVKLDMRKKAKLIAESRNVFLLNNDLIQSIQGTDEVILNKFLKTALIMVPLVWVLYRTFFKV